MCFLLHSCYSFRLEKNCIVGITRGGEGGLSRLEAGG